MTHQTNYMSGNVKRFGFLRNSTQTDWDDICSKNPCFSSACFSKAFRKFSVRRMTMFNIFENLCKIISLCSKKNYNHTAHRSKDINKRPLRFGKNTVYTNIHFYLCSEPSSNFAVYFNFKVLENFFKRSKVSLSNTKKFSYIPKITLKKKIKSIRLIFLKISHGTRGGRFRPPPASYNVVKQ